MAVMGWMIKVGNMNKKIQVIQDVKPKESLHDALHGPAKARRKAGWRQFRTFMEYMIFGTASMITSGIAGYATFKYLDFQGWLLWVACISIGITLTPAVFAIGRYIVQGAFNAAKEARN